MNNSTHKFKKFNLYRRKLKLTCSFLYKFSSLTSSGVLFKVLATCSIIDSIIKTAWLEPWTKYKKKVLLNCNIIETSPSLFSPAVKMIKVSNQFEVINLNKRKRKQEIIAIGFVTLTYWFCCSTLNKSQIVINSFFKAFFFHFRQLFFVSCTATCCSIGLVKWIPN